MSVMNVELYDALVKAGAGEESARAAASSVGDVNQLATKGDINLLRWMLGFNLALSSAILLALIFK